MRHTLGLVCADIESNVAHSGDAWPKKRIQHNATVHEEASVSIFEQDHGYM